jgi:hypothetical protein
MNEEVTGAWTKLRNLQLAYTNPEEVAMKKRGVH